MILGFVSAILPDLTLEEVLAFAAETGFESVEVMCWPVGRASRRYAGVTHLDVTDFTAADADRVKALIAKQGVSISALGYYPNPLSADPQEAEVAIHHLSRVITAAALLGIPTVNTFIGRDPHKTLDENWPRFLAVWPDLVQQAEEKQVRIGIENCPMYFTEDEWPAGKNLAVSPVVWRRMFDAIPSPHFGLNYDPSHLVWQQMDCLKPLREFQPRLFHIHAKDVRIDRHRLDDAGILAAPLEFHQPKLPGLGEIDWGRFFSELGAVGYQGHVAIEVEDRAYEHSLESRKAALRQSFRFLRNFV
jgi:sugar phosphate isomerase/epimerase